MTRQFARPAGTAQSARQTTVYATDLTYRRHSAAPRALFAAPPVDLTTLVIAEAIKRRAQAEMQREAAYEIPVSRERNYERGADIQPSDADE